MSTSETALIALCQKGQLEEFGKLYDRYVQKIYAYLYYRIQHKETAEDLTSQTFMKALESLPRFDARKGKFSSWLYSIARNTLYDHFRTQRMTADINNLWDLSSREDLPRDLDTREKVKAVEKYLAKLKPEQREIVIMRVWDGLSHQEIAQILGKNEASCKMAFSRAINHLKSAPTLVFLSFFILPYFLSRH